MAYEFELPVFCNHDPRVKGHISRIEDAATAERRLRQKHARSLLYAALTERMMFVQRIDAIMAKKRPTFEQPIYSFTDTEAATLNACRTAIEAMDLEYARRNGHGEYEE